MLMEVVGIDTIDKCEMCECTFCKKGPLGSNNCNLKHVCKCDGKCAQIIPHNTCPEFDPKERSENCRLI